VLIVRAPVAPERTVVLDRIYRMSESQFKQYWIARIFRAEATSTPKVVYSNQTINELVSAIPRAHFAGARGRDPARNEGEENQDRRPPARGGELPVALMAAPSVRRRLILSFLVILALFAVNEAISLWSDHAHAEAFRTLDRTLHRQSLISSISQDLGNLHKEVSLVGEVQFDPHHPPEPEVRQAFALRLAKVARDISELGRTEDRTDARASDTLADLFGELSTLWTEFYENLGVEPAWSVAFLARADPVAQRLLLGFLPRLEARGTRQAELARSDYDAVALRTRSVTALIFGLSTALGIVVAFQVSRYLVGRLAVLRRGADLIGEVNLQHRIPEEPCDELGDLAMHFNEMAGRLDVAQEKLRSANRELAEVNQLLSERIEEELAKVRLAARIQRDLLPQAPPQVPGYDIAGRSIPRRPWAATTSTSCRSTSAGSRCAWATCRARVCRLRC
jgi:HAMP domain-containing protein